VRTARRRIFSGDQSANKTWVWDVEAEVIDNFMAIVIGLSVLLDELISLIKLDSQALVFSL
jgi:hypothetical protein